MVVAKYRRKFNLQKIAYVVIIAFLSILYWVYTKHTLDSLGIGGSDGGRDDRSESQLDQEFDQYVASRDIETSPMPTESPIGRLDIYGFGKRPPKPPVWKTLETMVKPAEAFEDSLMSSGYFEPSGRFQFANLEPLANHIDQTIKDHQRFLSSNFVRLGNLVKRFPEIRERQLIEKKLVLVSSYSREFSRILRKEMKDFLYRTNLAQKSRAAIYKLKLRVQEAIERRQKYPCSRAIKCELTNKDGFAAGVHDVLWCVIRAFQADKRLVLNASSWHYLNDNFTWSDVFRDVDDAANSTCHNLPSSGLPGPNEDGVRKSIHSLPADIAEPLLRHHQDPYAWWFGQFMGHIMRPSELTEELLKQAKQSLGFKSPIVGLHIRRTDKLFEAAYREVEDYMEHAEEFYAELGADIPKRVFVATDEPRVLDELRENFPEFVFISNTKSAELANDVDKRDSAESFQGLILDLFLLSQTDKLVCTLSSGVCRVVYELMQARRTDASDHVVSLDVPYFYAYVADPPRKTIYKHQPVERKGMNLNVGNCVAKISSQSVVEESKKIDRYDGFSLGILCGSSLLAGSYPAFKTLPTVRVNGTRLSI
ncbi:alpha-(1,6)-fucosyltransferase-like [Galendromus occidentalis]|uniref:Alpha-(1,6)-fucosyltransferase-like n=1 Tax=Galendromus occidentalis TaxID=34638 RepID=A0AAJ6QMW6_9ACAR|nr:alpha-(1,6)-fucosyltransferase-like [Galendromus occidentalis]